MIWGGWHPSLFLEERLDERSIDVTVQGQGEETFVELVDRLAAGVSQSEPDLIAGTAERANGQVIRDPSRADTRYKQLAGAQLRVTCRRALFQAEGRAPVRPFISSTGLLLPLRFLRRSFCLQAALDRSGAGAHG